MLNSLNRLFPFQIKEDVSAMENFPSQRGNFYSATKLALEFVKKVPAYMGLTGLWVPKVRASP
jgi:hypothetical protein